MFVAGMIVGALFAYAICLWMYRQQQRNDAWWQENEGRRNIRWPVRPRVEVEVYDSIDALREANAKDYPDA
jgi:hypothetical protein